MTRLLISLTISLTIMLYCSVSITPAHSKNKGVPDDAQIDAFNHGYYGNSKHLHALFKVIQKPDVTLVLETGDKLSLEYLNTDFTREQLDSFLRNQHQKRLLLIEVSQTFWALHMDPRDQYPKRSPQLAAAMKPTEEFASQLGYTRVIILLDSGGGWWVFKDSKGKL